MTSVKWLVRLVAIEVFDFLVLPFQYLVTRKFGKSSLFVQVHDYSIYGHFALVTEILKSMEYLAKQRGMRHDLVLWSIGSRRKAVNKQLFRMVRRSLFVLPPPLISALLRNNSRWNAVTIPTRYPSIASLLQSEIGVLNSCEPQLHFSNREILRSQRRLEELEIPDPNRVVCLYLRDNKYLDLLATRKDKSLHRNANLDSYVEAVDYLCNMGFSVVRMGKYVAREFPYSHSNFVDYACSPHRCDELDMFLPSLSVMGITSGTGMDAGSFVFRRPTLMIDNGAFCEIPFQLSNLWWRPRMMLKGERVLSLQEILQSGIAQMWNDSHFESAGLNLVSANSKQIFESVRRFSDESNLSSMSSDLDRKTRIDADVGNLIELHLQKPYRAHLCSGYSKEITEACAD
jgi:putative glycosyltransferase (TIGR04372 family)